MQQMAALRLKPSEKWLLDKANGQFGLLRDEDLRGRLGRGGVLSRLEACRLTRLYPGIYAFGHTALRDEGLRLAAQWSVGGDATLSHLTAAAFHGWRVDSDDDRIHLSTTSTAQRSDLAVHRTRHLDRVDILQAGPFRVTHVPRTLVDLADVLPWRAFRGLVDHLPSVRLDKLKEAQARAPFRVGAPRVTRLIEADDAHTKSEFERRFLTFVQTHGIRRPDHLNHDVAGHKADAVYVAERLVVELDGRAYHERRAQMRADRHRDTDYQLAGYLILRLVWDDLHADEADATTRRLRRLLRMQAEA